MLSLTFVECCFHGMYAKHNGNMDWLDSRSPTSTARIKPTQMFLFWFENQH